MICVDGLEPGCLGGSEPAENEITTMETAAWLFWGAWGVIVYTYVVFPLGLALAARLFGPWKQRFVDVPDEDLPTVTMVVAAYNEAGSLPAKLANTWALDYPADRLRLLIGSDGSTDATNEILADCDNPRLDAVAFRERRGKISVLNDLMARVEMDLVVMSDANTRYSPDAVRKLVRHFQDPTVGCVSGELILDEGGGVSGEGIYWKYEGWIKRCESRLGFLIGCNGGIFALRPELYDPLPSGTLIEDFVLTLRVLEKRAKVLFDPEARAFEPPCPSNQAEMIRKTRIGAGGFQALGLTKKMLNPCRGIAALGYWSHKVLRWVAPFLLLGAVLTNIALIADPAYAYFLAAQLAAIAIGLQGLTPRAFDHKLVRPVRYFFLMNLALFIGFFRFLRGTQRVTWEQAARG
jgi:cellulose synthase/poly-beta-1,6-N-acetylglucosamine synthase-like glycosyltransferase